MPLRASARAAGITAVMEHHDFIKVTVGKPGGVDVTLVAAARVTGLGRQAGVSLTAVAPGRACRRWDMLLMCLSLKFSLWNHFTKSDAPAIIVLRIFVSTLAKQTSMEISKSWSKLEPFILKACLSQIRVSSVICEPSTSASALSESLTGQLVKSVLGAVPSESLTSEL